MTSVWIDGDMFVAEGGIVERLTAGRNDDWAAASPGDELLRPKLTASLVAGAGIRHAGAVYGYDQPNSRIVAWDKATGRYLGQYRLAGGGSDWQDLRGLYVLPGVEDGPATLVWLSKSGLHQAVLEAASTDAIGQPFADTDPEPDRRRRSRPRSPDPGHAPMIPLRDANPTRQTPVVTLGLIVACFVVFACELGLLASGGEAPSTRSSPRGASYRPT